MKTTKAAAKQSPKKPLTLADLTITWGGTDDAPQNTVTGRQLSRVLNVMRWAECNPAAPEEPSDFWPLLHNGLVAAHLLGIAQLIEDMGEREQRYEQDTRAAFLSSAQSLLAATVLCGADPESPQDGTFYRVHLPRAMAKGGPR